MKTSSPKNNENIYPVKIEHYKLIRDIGRGSYGLVYEAIVLKGPRLNEHVAVKQMNVDKLDQKKRNHLLVSSYRYYICLIERN